MGMIAVETIEVRNLERGERIPEDLLEKFPPEWGFDCEWTWVATEEGNIVGYLLGAPCHGVVIMAMLKMKEGYGHLIPRLLRQFVRDCLGRGYKGYMTYFNRDKSEQGKLWKIARRAGAIMFPFKVVCVGGALKDAARW